jgi:hypothetical protein
MVGILPLVTLNHLLPTSMCIFIQKFIFGGQVGKVKYSCFRDSKQGDITMKITLEASSASNELDRVSRPFSRLTNMAEVCVDNIQYDKAHGIVQIPMKRRDIIKQNRKGCLGWWRPPYIVGPNKIDSVLIIRQVVSMKMDVDDILVNECDSCFFIMMGVKIKPDQLYLGSHEEASGKHLCHIYITVKGINIELVDQDQKSTNLSLS